MQQTILLPACLGFAVFMFGMKIMELALHNWAGKYLTAILQKSTATPLHGLATGATTTAVLQSSTAVTVLSIGMVNAGLLTFPRTLGIILGTNIGTCLTTELLGLNLHRLAAPLLACACAAWLLTALLGELGLVPGQPGQPGQHSSGWLHSLRFGSVALGGFALLLLGMTMMQSIGPAVQQTGLFAWFLNRGADNLLWGLAAGTVLTALVHSSAAVIAMIMGLSAVGALPVELGIAIVIGSNVGTCATALLASIGGTRAGQYVAWSHVLLNVCGAIVFAPLVTQLHAASALFSSSPAAQIAHAQTIFNILCSLLALPLCYLPVWKKLNAHPRPQ